MKKGSRKKSTPAKAQPSVAQIGSAEYGKLLTEVKKRVRSAQLVAFRAVNKELVALYWDIGRMIVSRQAGETWGKSVVQKLSVDLQSEFPGIQGFSSQNLWYMRQFYTEYRSTPKLQLLVGEISWSKNLIMMVGCIASFVLLLIGIFPISLLEAMVLAGWSHVGLVGHQFIHAGFWLIGFWFVVDAWQAFSGAGCADSRGSFQLACFNPGARCSRHYGRHHHTFHIPDIRGAHTCPA